MTARLHRWRDWQPSTGWVLRTPLLPFDVLGGLGRDLEGPEAAAAPQADLARALDRDRVMLVERLRSCYRDPVLREAMAVASPTLLARMSEESELSDADIGAMMSYIVRAAGRPVPFALFAGCTLGALGTSSVLKLGGLSRYRKTSRLDSGCVAELVGRLLADPALWPKLTYRPNTSLLLDGTSVRFVQQSAMPSAGDGLSASPALVEAPTSPALLKLLDRAEEGAGWAQLLTELAGHDPAAADQFLATLVAAEVLVPEQDMLVTGSDPLEALEQELLVPSQGRTVDTASTGSATGSPAADENVDGYDGWAHALGLRDLLSELDACGVGSDLRRYDNLATTAGRLGLAPRPGNLLHTQLHKPPEQVQLSDSVLADLLTGAEALTRMAAPGDPDLVEFRAAFERRFGDADVPLLVALDPDRGIEFPVPVSSGSEEVSPWRQVHDRLVEPLLAAASAGCRELNVENLLTAVDGPGLAEAFSVLGSVAASSAADLAAGRHRVLVRYVNTASGAQLFGRFTGADADIRDLAKAHLRAEEAQHPERLYAEVVSLPHGDAGIGNIVHRPLLRSHEIPYLGRSGAPRHCQILPRELTVAVLQGRIVLRWERTGQEVVPRLSIAHAHRDSAFAVYRFLCALQRQDGTDAAWDWGPFDVAAHLPRIVLGRRVLLARERWTLDRTTLSELRQRTTGYAAVQRWRSITGAPRWMLLKDGDRELPLDLDNILAVDLLAWLVRNSAAATLIEMFPSPEELCVEGPEGRFVHELVVPFTRPTRPSESPSLRPPASPPQSRTAAAPRVFPPGSEWLTVLLHTTWSSTDRVLVEVVAPVVASAVASGSVERWFFVRLNHHDAAELRVRCFGEATRLQTTVLPAMSAAVASRLGPGDLLHRMQVDTYLREVHRYGGTRGVELAEQIFSADSEAVLILLSHPDTAGFPEPREALAMMSISRLLSDFGFDVERRRAWTHWVRDAYLREHEPGLRHWLGAVYRSRRTEVEGLLDSPAQIPAASIVEEVFAARSAAIRPLAEEFAALDAAGALEYGLDVVLQSLVHMSVNRLLRADARLGELAALDALNRAYNADIGRLRPTSPTDA